MVEKRQYGRLSFPFPVRLETLTTKGKKVLNLVTRDMSAFETLIPTTPTSFNEETQFILDLTFPGNKNQRPKDLKILKVCIGSLVRSTLTV